MENVFKKKLNKRGVTIVEALVAMIVIVIVSSAAIKCIESFSVSSANMVNKNEAVVAAENALEIFKATESYEEYRRTLMPFLYVSPETSSSNENENGSVYFDNYNISGYHLFFILRYNDDATASFEATVRDAKNHLVLKIDEYRKALADPATSGNEDPEGGN